MEVRFLRAPAREDHIVRTRKRVLIELLRAVEDLLIHLIFFRRADILDQLEERCFWRMGREDNFALIVLEIFLLRVHIRRAVEVHGIKPTQIVRSVLPALEDDLLDPLRLRRKRMIRPEHVMQFVLHLKSTRGMKVLRIEKKNLLIPDRIAVFLQVIKVP